MNHNLPSGTELFRTFIFECLTTRLTSSDLNAAIDLAQRPNFNWDELLRVADEELVSPLLHAILQGRQIAPRSIEKALTRKHDFIARRNLFLLHQLASTLTLLNSAGIEVIVLKGAALTETIYKNIALRPMRDLDLLIHRDQQPQALELLAKAGYAQRTVMLGDTYPITMSKPGIEPVELELHWTLFHSRYYQQQLSIDWFWQTAHSVETATLPMTVLGHEAQILHLCGHLAFHHTHQPQLLWHNDLAEFIFHKKEAIRWDHLIDKAQTFQLLLTLRQVLLPLARDWGAPVPQGALQRLQSLPVSDAERQAFALSTTIKQSEGQGYWFRLKEIPGWRKRLLYVLKWLFPAPDTLRARYGILRPWLVPLAYPYHWWVALRLVLEALFTGWGKNAASD